MISKLKYSPISREEHLKRGACCYEQRNQKSRCIYCPWYVKEERNNVSVVDPRLAIAMQEAALGGRILFWIEEISLIERVDLIGGNLTILQTLDRDLFEKIQQDILFDMVYIKSRINEVKNVGN
jgi:hypothetical protein